MIKIKHRGNFNNVERFFNRMLGLSIRNILAEYGEIGVGLLQQSTPKDTGHTRDCWSYTIETTGRRSILAFENTNIKNGVNIAIILNYGHGTNNGGYVAGRNYINPTIQPLFDKIADDLWKKVTSK